MSGDTHAYYLVPKNCSFEGTEPEKSCCQFLPVRLIPLFKKCDNAIDCFHSPDTASCWYAVVFRGISHPHLAVLIKTLLWSNQLSTSVCPKKPGVSLVYRSTASLGEAGRQPVTDWWMRRHSCATVSSLHSPPTLHSHSPTRGEDRGVHLVMHADQD